MKRLKLVVFMVLLLIGSVCLAAPKGFVEFGYFGNGDFSEDGFGGFNIDGRIFFKQKSEGLFVNLNPIMFAAGDDFAWDNDLPTYLFTMQIGGGYQRYLNKVLYIGASSGVGFGSGEYPATISYLSYTTSSAETKSVMVTSWGLFLGFTAPKNKNFGFSGKIGLKGMMIDSEPVMGFEMSAGFRIGK